MLRDVTEPIQVGFMLKSPLVIICCLRTFGVGVYARGIKGEAGRPRGKLGAGQSLHCGEHGLHGGGDELEFLRVL